MTVNYVAVHSDVTVVPNEAFREQVTFSGWLCEPVRQAKAGHILCLPGLFLEELGCSFPGGIYTIL